MNVVMTMSRAKETYIQVRVREDLKDDVRVTAEARGLTISALIHSLLTQAVREEKNAYPHLFVKYEQNANTISKRKLAPVVARIEPPIDPKVEVRRMLEKDARQTIPVLKRKAK